MNWRALGCGGLAALVFVAIGVLGLTRVLAPADCPPGFQFPDATFVAVGERTSEPRLASSDEELEPAGELRFGYGWELWLPPGTAPSASGEPLPDALVLGCPDGSFQAYRRDAP